MSTNSPKISVLCPSYNHEKFISYFIESVLNQTEQDFELIIVDDCSSDETVKEVEKFSDKRIKLIKHQYNQGINAGLNDSFEIAKGEYCVFIASDDILELNHLEVSSKYLDKNTNINVFYSSLSLIDENNLEIKDKDNIYLRNNNNKFDILRQMFFCGNVLLSPGMVVRRKALEQIMPLNLGMLQYQDYQMHVLLLLNNEMYQTEDRLVNYRQISGNKNTSSRIFEVIKREALEEISFMDSFLNIKDVDLLIKIFGDRINQFGIPIAETIPYFLARLALLSRKKERKTWGYYNVMNFIKNKKNLELLNELYEFDFSKYVELLVYFR